MGKCFIDSCVQKMVREMSSVRETSQMLNNTSKSCNVHRRLRKMVMMPKMDVCGSVLAACIQEIEQDCKMGCFGSKDKLSKEDMDFLKSHTRYDELTIKEWYKGFKQDCPNGRLTPAKFVDMYKMFFPSGNAEEFCDHVFRTFDMDKNGYIDFKEFLLAIDVTSSGTPEEKLKWAFRMYDVDGNGVIDIQEMTKIVQAIYDMLGACSSNRPADSAEERAKNIFAKMDENNDGQLTQEEFLKGCLQDEELSKMLAP
ncbi:neuronal calcium sensor 2 isoform X1 [Ptiloglossa arizonensis]|uniref:neuronal calcium sensor 2 isoform X1 n=2 Tax=Ptiloglossa arizonensis TaxID=3350558 RepID=UPI003FA0FBBA